MNRSTLLIVRLCFAVIALFIMLNRCHQRDIKQYQFEHTWTAESEQQVRDVFITKLATSTADDSTKNAYVDCCMEKIKELFPHGPSGMLDGHVSDSTKTALLKAAAECQSSLVWTPEVVQQMEQKFYSFPEIKQLPEAGISEYVNCLAFRVETKFPNGLTANESDSLIRQVITQAREECGKTVREKYKGKK